MKNITHFLALLSAFLALPLCRAQDSTLKTVSAFSYAGVPAGGTSEIDTITITGTSGTFTIGVANSRTVAVTATNVTATLLSNIDAALEGLPVIGTGGVTTAAGTMTTGTGTVTLTFTGKNARMDFPLLSIASHTLTAGTVTLTTTTAGVAATYRDAPTGTVIIDSTNADIYINTSTTASAPTWTAQSRVGGKAGLYQLTTDGTALKIYNTATTGLIITGTGVNAVTSF